MQGNIYEAQGCPDCAPGQQEKERMGGNEPQPTMTRFLSCHVGTGFQLC